MDPDRAHDNIRLGDGPAGEGPGICPNMMGEIRDPAGDIGGVGRVEEKEGV